MASKSGGWSCNCRIRCHTDSHRCRSTPPRKSSPSSWQGSALSGRVLCDADANLTAAYGFGDADPVPAACLVRPDGYVSYRTAAVDVDRLLDHLRPTIR